MQTIDQKTYGMLAGALKMAGTYDPEEVLSFIEEQLTQDEARTLTDFLGWCHRENKPFGVKTYKTRFSEWKKAQN